MRLFASCGLSTRHGCHLGMSKMQRNQFTDVKIKSEHNIVVMSAALEIAIATKNLSDCRNAAKRHLLGLQMR